jgi:hypothetical protein
MTDAICRQSDRLKDPPRPMGFGKLVGQRIVVASPFVRGCVQRLWTPWMQFVPQSYSGTPSRGTSPPGDWRAVNMAAFSARLNRPIRSFTRACVERLKLQNGKPDVSVVLHARPMEPSPYGLGRL